MRTEHTHSDLKKTIADVYTSLQKEQYKDDQDFSVLPPRLEKQKGLYASYIKGNILDEKNSWFTAQVRENFNLADNNMFVTNFVLYAILESVEIGAIELQGESFRDAINAVLSFHDKNYGDNVPIYSFWPQTLVNDTWSAVPTNIQNYMDLLPDFPPWVQTILEKIGLKALNYLNDFAKILRIPADTDDSGCNLALGALLSRMQSRFPDV